MVYVQLTNASVEFPLHNADQRSLKRLLSTSLTKGRFSVDTSNRPIFRGLRNVSLSLNEGDRVAIIGPNGAGKSTLLRVMAGIYPPTSGFAVSEGRIGALLTVGLGMRDDVSGWDNIDFGLLLLGVPTSSIPAKRKEIADFTELSDALSLHVGAYSAGMRTRLAFGIATSIEPEILILDEVFGAGDAAFLAKAEARMKELMSKAKILAFASHSIELIERFCSKAIWVEGGEIRQFGPLQEVSVAYMVSSQKYTEKPT